MTPSPEERAAYARKAKPPWNLKAAESEIARLREELRLNADTLEAAEQQVAELRTRLDLVGTYPFGRRALADLDVAPRITRELHEVADNLERYAARREETHG